VTVGTNVIFGLCNKKILAFSETVKATLRRKRTGLDSLGMASEKLLQRPKMEGSFLFIKKMRICHILAKKTLDF